MAQPVELPEGFLFRRPRREDVPGIVALMRAVDLEDMGVPDSSEEDVLSTWTLPRFQTDRDAWLVTGPDGKVAGYAWVWDRKPHVEIQADSYVLPALASSGLEKALLLRMEERAEEHRAAAPRTEEVRIRLFTSPRAAPRIAAFTGRGYARERTFCRMTIDLPPTPPAPRWPEGIAVQAFDRQRDARAADLAIQESFADHFGFVHEPHEEWIERRMAHAGFDPGLWALAWEGTVVAGAILTYLTEGEGWVRELGVRPGWRRRGIGRALLLHAFGELARRGVTRVGLGVDAANTTGATGLYESVGMQVAFRHDLYEKRLGFGRGA